MTKEELANLLTFLEELAPTNPERTIKLREMLLKASKDEVQQLDSASITWLLGVVEEAERKDIKMEVVIPTEKASTKFVGPVRDMRVRDEEWDESDYWWGM